jgi:hypothetical protein
MQKYAKKGPTQVAIEQAELDKEAQLLDEMVIKGDDK